MTTEPVNKGGAPRNNVNAAVHGGRSANPALCLGSWGTRHQHALRQALAYRRSLVAQCEKVYGGVGPTHAEWIQLAVQADMSVRVLKKMLANAKPGELSAKDESALLAQLMNYSTTRQRAVAKLRLQTDRPVSPWDAIDAELQAEADQDALEAAGDDFDGDGVEHDQDAERPGAGAVGDEAGDSDSADLWREVDAEIGREREADG